MVQRRRQRLRHTAASGDTGELRFNLTLAAISDPTRRAILERLARGPARISDLAQPFRMSLTGFCKHVRVLERARLVRRTRRGRDNTLQLSPEPLRAVADWVLNYEHFWNERLDRLEAYFVNQARKKERSGSV